MRWIKVPDFRTKRPGRGCLPAVPTIEYLIYLRRAVKNCRKPRAMVLVVFVELGCLIMHIDTGRSGFFSSKTSRNGHRYLSTRSMKDFPLFSTLFSMHFLQCLEQSASFTVPLPHSPRKPTIHKTLQMFSFKVITSCQIWRAQTPGNWFDYSYRTARKLLV